jgi:hypothetical protein
MAFLMVVGLIGIAQLKNLRVIFLHGSSQSYIFIQELSARILKA